MAELDVITVIVAAQAVSNIVIGALYSFLRLRKEERKVKIAEAAVVASNASFAAMVKYHSQRLDLETEKLELARRNGQSERGESAASLRAKVADLPSSNETITGFTITRETEPKPAPEVRIVERRAHSIKNPHIIHYFIRESDRGVHWETRKPYDYRRLAYLCIRASSTTPSKRTRDVSQVTCKNCLQRLMKRGIYSGESR